MRKNQILTTVPGEYIEVVQGDHCVAIIFYGSPVFTPKQARKLAKALKRAARYSEEVR